MSLPPTIDIRKRLEEMPSEELFALAEEIEGLQADPRWIRLQELANASRDAAREALEFGPIREQADYARWLGFINGFRVQPDLARSIVEAAAERRQKLERAAALDDAAADRA